MLRFPLPQPLFIPPLPASFSASFCYFALPLFFKDLLLFPRSFLFLFLKISLPLPLFLPLFSFTFWYMMYGSVSSFHTSRNPISFVRSLIQQRIFSLQSPSSRSNLERSHYVHKLLNYLVESKTQVSHEDWTNHLIEDVVSFALSELKETAGLTNFPNEADSHFSSARRTLERIQASEEREIFSRFLSEQQDKIGTHPSQVEHIRQIEESVLRREGEVELEKERKELIAVEKHRLSVLTSELIQERDQLSEYIEEEFNFQEEERESRHLEEIDFCERWKLELEDRKRLREEQQRQDKKSDIQIDHDSSSGSHSFLRDLDSLIERATISSHSPVNKSPKESSKHLYKKNFITNMSDSMQPGSPKTSGTKRKLILLMTVEIGDGRVDTIRIHQGDRADDLASSFIRKHGLSDSVFPPLRNHIEAHMQQIQPDTGDTESITQSKDRGKDSVSESALATSKQSRPGTSPSASSTRGTLRQNLPKQPNKASASEAPLSRKRFPALHA